MCWCTTRLCTKLCSRGGGVPAAALVMKTLYLPLVGSTGIVGVLGLTPAMPESLSQHAQRRQLDAFVSQMALAMERAKLAQEAETARRDMEAEQLRNSLLSSVSHDLRTPLAVITGATSTPLQGRTGINDSTRQDLLSTIGIWPR